MSSEVSVFNQLCSFVGQNCSKLSEYISNGMKIMLLNWAQSTCWTKKCKCIEWVKTHVHWVDSKWNWLVCHTQLGTIIGFETVNGNCYDVTDNGERGARFVTVVCESVCGCLSDHRTSAVQRISRATELPPSESSRSVVRLDVVTLIARISADVFSIAADVGISWWFTVVTCTLVFLCLSVCLSVCVHVCLSVCMSVCLSVGTCSSENGDGRPNVSC